LSREHGSLKESLSTFLSLENSLLLVFTHNIGKAK